MVVFENNNVVIEYDAEKEQLKQVWVGYILSDDFREAIDRTVEFTKTNTVTSIISDTHKQKVVKPSDVDYATAALPEMFMNGLKAMAFIIPADIFTKFSLRTFEEKKQHEKIAYFPTFNEANSWIEQIEK